MTAYPISLDAREEWRHAPEAPWPSVGQGRRLRGFHPVLLGLFALLAGAAAPAQADILQISAAGLVRHCPCGTEKADDSLEENGVLTPVDQNRRYFAPVMFPVNGERVCSFSLVYRDQNAGETIRASLKRKVVAIGGDPFAPPTTMAEGASAGGTSDTVRRETDRTIAEARIRTQNSFYYVEVLLENINMSVIGVQIDMRPTCPQP